MKLKVLIVEDNEESVILLTTILQKYNPEFLIASNGEEAVKLCRENPDINIILMDFKMPVMSGYEATKKIREFNKDVIIIAQTAYAREDDRKRALEIGCNDYISKPIRVDELSKKINELVLND